MKTPVVFIIFNRPEATEMVLSQIAKTKPTKLLVVADGPCPNRPREAELCRATRKIIDRIDWDCELLTNYSDINMGCKRRVSSGLDWVFSKEKQAIILEDDCLPTQSFFQFCQQLLDKHKDDKRIAQISGVNFQFGRNKIPHSYYYSRYSHIWGWATWQRSWQLYDVTMSRWGDISKTKWLEELLGDRKQAKYWSKIYDAVYEGKIDTWDYQWAFTCWLNDMLTIIPNVNMISNIGFGKNATHTKGMSIFSEMDVNDIQFPLKSPETIKINKEADNFTNKLMFQKSILRKVRSGIERVLRG